ncbi:TolC family protein [Fibrella aquatilis]|uniref:TolC family protein n=1 Tax=Fibrella aquatilis TaxID=2817059 RepID=A0A939G6X3_9BACT|nr:TolC family protein [Fibrella aquatilis]MBO0932986.1 TolC family protein [Fibrella aquatilis]
MRYLLFILFLSSLGLLPARPALAQQTVLSGYVQLGLQADLNLKQQQFQLQKALLMLDETRTAFRPTVQFNTTYSTAVGGRQIAFPVGSLLNPVYTTLNKLTETKQFPQVADYKENFYPKDFYDTRFHTMMPLINAELRLQRSLQGEQINALKAEQDVYRRELTKTIKMAYFQYLKAAEVVVICETGLRLLTDTERFNKSLVQNGKANPTVLVRMQGELGSARLRLEEARSDQQQAALYLNHLLNRAPAEPVLFDSTYRATRPQAPLTDGNREELAGLRSLMSAQQLQLQVNKVSNKPKLGLSLDVGSQGNVATLAGGDQNFLTPNGFILAGISFDLPIYTAGRRQLKMAQNRADIAATELRLTQTLNDLNAQMQQAELAFQAALTRYDQQKEQQPWADRYYRDLMKLYREGMVGYVELLDAQNQVMKQQIEQTLRLYDAWIRLAQLERVKG